MRGEVGHVVFLNRSDQSSECLFARTDAVFVVLVTCEVTKEDRHFFDCHFSLAFTSPYPPARSGQNNIPLSLLWYKEISHT